MIKTDVSMRIHLPFGQEQCERCKMLLVCATELVPNVETVMCFDDGEEEALILNFGVKELNAIDRVTEKLTKLGAHIMQQSILISRCGKLSGRNFNINCQADFTGQSTNVPMINIAINHDGVVNIRYYSLQTERLFKAISLIIKLFD